MLNYAELRHSTSDKIISECMSNDGRFIATGIYDFEDYQTFNDEFEAEENYERMEDTKIVNKPHIKIWDLWSQKVVKMIREDHNVYLLKFSNDNKYLFSCCSYSKFIKVRDTATWNIINEINPCDSYDDINNIVFSPDKKCFIITSTKGELLVYNAENFNKIRIIAIEINKKSSYGTSFEIEKKDVFIFSHDGRYLIYSYNRSGNIGRTIIWNTNKWEIEKIIEDTYATKIAISFNENLLAIPKNDDVTIINLENYEEKTVKANGDESFKMDLSGVMIFSPNNEYLIVNGGYIEETKIGRNGEFVFPDFTKTKCLSVFSTKTMKLEKCYRNISIDWMNFNSDGDLIFSYDNSIKVIDIGRWTEVFNIKDVGYLGSHIEYNSRNEILATILNEQYALILHTTKSSLEKYKRRERSKEDSFKYDCDDGVAKYDYDSRGNIENDGGYNRNGYDREGRDEEGLDEWGYDEDRNGACD